MRTGVTPSGHQLRDEYMPYKSLFGDMTDEEWHAIWLAATQGVWLPLGERQKCYQIVNYPELDCINDVGGVTMQKWVKDGLTGLGPVAALTFIVSVATNAPYTLFSTVIYSLFIGIILGTPGGILVGRKHERSKS